VRLSHSVIGRLEGTASGVTVTRTDLGSVVGLSTVTHVDSYIGYDTTPKAQMLTAVGATTQLTLSGGRPIVTDGGARHTVAYVSDVMNATNGVSGALQSLRDADTALGGRIDVESAARNAGDAALSGRLDSVKAILDADISKIGTHWGSQLSNFSAALDDVYTRLDALREAESNDVRALQQSIADVTDAYAAADGLIRDSLTALRAAVNKLDDGLDSRINERADARIAAASNSIIAAATSRAVAASKNYTDSVRNNLTATINANNEELQTRISPLEVGFQDVKGKINNLIYLLRPLTNNTYSPITLPAPLP
jgi:hypothetical protein